MEKLLKYRGRLKEDTNYFNKFCSYRISWLCVSVEDCFFVPGTGRASFTLEFFISHFQEEKRDVKMLFLRSNPLLFF